MNKEKPEWIRHDGQRVPDGLAPDAVVEVRFRDGESDKDVASKFEWTHHPGIVGSDADILEYRVAQEGSGRR
jgi:hypothetical protein